ncbi:sigma-70 family RNA polymerase sigma factor [Rhodoferax sediminis]|uniref:Sigma-70 family RNA polymerase sigma factor n=1 Tax=Rhodoferax sediminis TaxID=2509614 RepID=A0A515D7N5_9BURK|nr:sigma-70 family RNA polymerase sigma factor [Rhodoferax sediminis]QDL36425.1 sigma-70 family RNA polymerase sigma factor [Rhodoferax sediminis]
MTLLDLPITGDAPMCAGAAISELDLEGQLPSLRQRLLRHARFALSDTSLAEDLVQDTLMAVVEQRDQHRGVASLVTWATAILKNKIADWYRSPARRRIVQLSPDDEKLDDAIDALYDPDGAYTDPIPAWQQPDNLMEQRQMMTVLERCVSCLPRQTGRIFMMREWLGFETTEICERVGVSAENCRTIMHRARMALRGCMQRDWINTKANV